MAAADLALAGLALLVLAVASEQFVTGTARVATSFGASPIFIGAVILGAGTSLPDGLVSGIAAARGDSELAVGNVVGSNSFNIAVALGAAALIIPVAARRSVLKREAVLSLAAVTLFYLLALVGIGTVAGALLLLLTVPALWLIRGAQGVDAPASPPLEVSRGREIARVSVGLVLTVVSSRLLVVSAEDLAMDFGISEAVIGFTLVAIGTSIPELAVSVQAARRGASDLIVGNVLGSNLLNSLGVAGVAALLSPRALELGELADAGVLMLMLTVTATLLLATGRRLVRSEGVALIAAYVIGSTVILT
ncbi:MAG: sodium:calcium antiporter [Solirubrobacterales bacterium]